MKTEFAPAFLLLLVLSFASFGQATIVVVDPTKPAKQATLSAAEQSLIDKVAMPKLKAKYQGENCPVEPEFAGVARGTFTGDGAPQAVAFFQVCQTGNGLGIVALVLIESGKVVGVYGSDSGWSLDIGALPDINGDGYDEFTLSFGGGMHQGQGGVGVDIMQFSGGLPKGIGWFQAEQFADTEAVTCWKVTAKRGKTPVYYRQKFTSRENSKWIPVGKSTAFKPTKTPSNFEAVK